MPDAPPDDSTAPSPGTNRLDLAKTEPAPDFPVVGIGASAGGLDACRRLVGAIPRDSGMAFILVQHLDPTYHSMMVELLADHTAMPVQQATEGLAIERDHVYVIPPGSYLSVAKGLLHLTVPQDRHGARLPFDFLLVSLAREFGPRAMCVVLSGTGSDGSEGLVAIKAAGGFVIAQDPKEAEYDGMPRSAVQTGKVDKVLPAGNIGAALDERWHHPDAGQAAAPPAPALHEDCLPAIIQLLREKAGHNFSLYKPGTLRRRIERRMALAGIEATGMDRYLTLLQGNGAELEQLAKDLLINVTTFFRDPKVFEYLEQKIVPQLIAEQMADRPLRIWVAGCSSGEEAYSLAMILREQLVALKSHLKLQIFASDADIDAISSAREGLYPDTIAANVSSERLARFFTKEDAFYRVTPELRGCVVFTVQDVLADPPFSRLDLVSCRNLLIYLAPEAQAKVISIFHFALREGGILLLGNTETVGAERGRFELISKPDRLYRHIGKKRPGDLSFTITHSDGSRVAQLAGQSYIPSREAEFAEVCSHLLMDSFAPAAVLINHKRECLYYAGPTNRYLTLPSGQATHDLLAMAREGLRAKITFALRKAERDRARVLVSGGTIKDGTKELAVSLDVQPVRCGGDDLLLVCFIDRPHPGRTQTVAADKDAPRIAELEQELSAKKTELHEAIRELDISNEEQKAINEEALSVNEEYQSTNEELLTSKEELQSLNEELTALNAQLQETLERQRVTSDDLQNVLNSTNIATLFLDTKLNIRYFTPATKLLFNMIPSDIGRPLADLHPLGSDPLLVDDMRAVLHGKFPIEREIEAQGGVWFMRRVMPYRTHDNQTEGVVITFTDVTERKAIGAVLQAAKQQAEHSNAAKSHFLAVASHDLRQPLQTLSLLQGLLAKIVEGDKAKKLVARLDETLAAISSMLNTLLDINQIDAGTVHAEIVDFPLNDLLDRLSDEFTYYAQAQGLKFRAVSSSAVINSDPRLLEQMIRNLLSNAFKYTKQGKVLLGCRHRGDILSIEILDTGLGIPASEFELIFKEYHQLDNVARERSRGLGLGLSIVQRLGTLLGHHVWVRSIPGKGSVFGIDITLPDSAVSKHHAPKLTASTVTQDTALTGTILVVDDDPDVRELLAYILAEDGHHIATAEDGNAALDLVSHGHLRPDLLLTDFNLPGGMNGLELTVRLRECLKVEIPGIVLTGDISTGTLRDIAALKCTRLNKPVKFLELAQVIARLLPIAKTAARTAPVVPVPRRAPAKAIHTDHAIIFVVDDDANIREAIRSVLEEDGKSVETYPDCEAFLAAFRPGGEACLLIDAYLPGMSGLGLLKHLRAAGHHMPAIMITGNSDVPMAVEAMKAGASDFIEKPIGGDDLLAAIERALDQARDYHKLDAMREDAANQVAGLTSRQREIMTMVLAGHPSKNIAADLGISQRTVENHRASIMKKTGCKSMPALARLAMAAATTEADTQAD
jgi:two-component system CheB/CheR fusion protein